MKIVFIIIFLSIYTTYKYLEKKKVEITDKELIINDKKIKIELDRPLNQQDGIRFKKE